MSAPSRPKRELVPVRADRHRTLRWRRIESYGFAGDSFLQPLAAAELGQAALALPLTFIRLGECWSLCALLGFQSGQNLYVEPDGRWIAAYVPAGLRCHPFHLGWEGQQASLCVDEASGLLAPDGPGELIYDDSGELGSSVREVWSFLSQVAHSIVALEAAAGMLAEAGVLEPLPISVKTPGGPRAVEGLHRVGEAALNGLNDAAFGELRRVGAAAVAYAQLLSLGNLADLGRLAQARAEAEVAQRARAAIPPLIHLPEDNTIDWDWSRIGR